MAAVQNSLVEKDISPRIDRFKQLLVEQLQNEIMYTFSGVRLKVDYKPEGLLRKCWVLSDPESRDTDGLGRFPFKTTMRIYKEKITINETLII